MFYLILRSAIIDLKELNTSNMSSNGVGTDGDGISRIIVYSGPDFSGESKTIVESVPNVGSVIGSGNKIESMVVQGNPWLFFPEEQMKVWKILMFSKSRYLHRFIQMYLS